MYDGDKLLQSETMDFQIHLYRFGEMEQYLKEVGFTKIEVFSSFEKNAAENNSSEMFLYVCSV